MSFNFNLHLVLKLNRFILLFVFLVLNLDNLLNLFLLSFVFLKNDSFELELHCYLRFTNHFFKVGNKFIFDGYRLIQLINVSQSSILFFNSSFNLSSELVRVKLSFLKILDNHPLKLINPMFSQLKSVNKFLLLSSTSGV